MEFEFPDLNTIGIIVVVLVIGIVLLIEMRDLWNPPIRSKGTPKFLKSRVKSPVCDKGRPAVLHDEQTQSMVQEEVDEFHEFLRRTDGYVLTKKGKLPIPNAQGRLSSWSYRPFRDGDWWSLITTGIRDPERFYWFGTPSLIPNPEGNEVESPLTLVVAEEEILRCIRGTMTVRIFPRNQPTFPKFDITEHGDYVCDSTRHKLRGEEFVIDDGAVLFIPRGWAYRVHVDSACVALVRIPVWGVLSGGKHWISLAKARMSSNRSKKSRPLVIDDTEEDDGPDNDSIATSDKEQ